MHNFLRALKQAIPHWPSLVFATICSFGVAALWGANIGAFLPILQVTIQGKSIQEHVQIQIDESEQRLETIRAEVKHQTQLSQDPNPAISQPAHTRLASLGLEFSTFQSKLSGLRKLQPWVDNYLPNDPFQAISWIVIALIVSTLVKHVFLLTNEYLVGRVALTISRDIRMAVFDKAMHMDRAGYAQFGAAGFTAQITHTTDMLSSGLMNALGAAIREPLKVIACLVGAGLICWRLLLLSVLVAPLVGWMLVTVTRRLKAVSQRVLSQAAGFHDVMHESFGSIQTIQAYQMEQHESERFGEATLAMKNFGQKFIFYSSLSKPIIEFLGLGMLGTTIVGGAYLVLNKETHLLGIPISNEPLSVEALLVFFGMLIGISDPLRKLSAVYSSVYAGTMAADALHTVLDHKTTIADPEVAQPVGKPHQMLSLRDVSFGYEQNQPILSNVSLDIPYGTTVAIVGHNGSGKSTLINLLCRFYDPCGGGLQLDGVDLRSMTLEDLRSRIALVNQHTELFNDSVSYNIRYGKLDATDQEVELAARMAHAHEFIVTALEQGYDTVVGHNGQKLSGGQRQRIALARALLCHPEFLILDEATSQIDMKSEQLIRESLAERRGECTLIIITHREKLLELADRVYEVRDGALAEIHNPHRKVA